MMVRLRRAAAAVLLAVVLLVTGAGAASAAPEQGPGGTPTMNGQQLPEGFPAELRKFVAGTDEFQAAWFDGECANRGGDFGSYLAGVLGSRDGRPVEVDLINAAYGQDWSHSFPNGDPAFIPKNPMCADDLKKFAQPQTTTWGFQFADTPDDASIEAMKAAIEANPAADMPDSSDLGEEFFTGQVCDYGDDRAPAQLCLHRFYLNCDKAEGRVDREACTSWNVRVGELQGGAYYWWDQNRGFTERLSDSASNTFGAYADGFSSIWSVTGKPVVETVKFMADPGSVIDDWANALKSSAVDLTEKVIRGLTTTGSFDTTNDTFLTWYAYSTGIGILAMAITAILAAQRISDGKRHPRDLLMDYGGYMLFGVVAMLFAPGLAAVFLSFIEQVSQGIGDALGAPADQVVTNMSAILGQATSETVAGGAIAGIILFGLMLIGVLAAYFGLLMHAAGLPILLCVAGIGFGMWVHPKWRQKAMRPVMMFVGLALMKPLLLLLLGVTFATINIFAGTALGGASGMELFTALGMIAVCFVMVGLAPWALLKYAPIMPSSEDSADFGSGGSAAGMAAGGMAGYGAGMLRGGGGGRSAASRYASAASAPGRTSGGMGAAAGGGGASGGSRPGGSASTQQAAAAGRKHSGAAAGGGGRGGGSSVGGHALGAAKAGGRGIGAAGRLTKAAAAGGIPIAVSAAGAAMNKAASSAQSAPNRADGGVQDE
ncbi:hypothetical protein [Tomitella cavernea]|uniref:TrbL/VirB6 plasmid conjugal transfer protein n=2 Tax=Tomitella cavernea TaxID=1387982 RepID=A0ABP9D4R8_9ACTN